MRYFILINDTPVCETFGELHIAQYVARNARRWLEGKGFTVRLVKVTKPETEELGLCYADGRFWLNNSRITRQGFHPDEAIGKVLRHQYYRLTSV